MARAAAVQAARQAFEDKEAAKTRKIEQQTIKAKDKQFRRKEKKDQHSRKLKSRPEHSLSETRPNEKRPSLEGTEYGRMPLAEHTDSLNRGISSKPGKSSRGVASPKSAWVLFLTWVRTKIFKLGKKIKKSG
jgi:hypothetical protein